MALFNQTNVEPIRQLDQSVINKISAGEVIHRPLNVVKELLENSLDAGASNIVITLKNAGFKSITIQDNGCGIKKEDLTIVCKRFTTSKLTVFDDLKSLSTFGFRGEALSSISTVSHLTIVTRTADSAYGYKAEYIDGNLKLNSSVSAIAANPGTTILVENLFYNMPVRKAALSSESAEFCLVQEMITKYAILHSQKCAFILKKQGESAHVINTQLVNDMLKNVNLLYGNDISSKLCPLQLHHEKLNFSINGYFSNGDLNLKRMQFLLFINNRLVECSSLQKLLKNLYKNHLMKGCYPFVLFILQLDPKNIDVNVHPTKNEVSFLYQNEIFDLIIRNIETRLVNNYSNQIPSTVSPSLSQSKLNFLDRDQVPNTKTDLSFRPVTSKITNIQTKANNTRSIGKTNVIGASKSVSSSSTFIRQSSLSNSSVPVIRPNRQVRTDSKEQRISQYLKRRQNDCKNRRNFYLSSLNKMRREVVQSVQPEYFDMLTKSTYVGCVDEQFALIQHELELILVNTVRLNKELFYQICLVDFGNFDYIRFKKSLPLEQLLSFYFKVNGTKNDEVIQQIGSKVDNLLLNADMLDDYFSIKFNVSEKSLEAIPRMVDGHLPAMCYLPHFVYRLAFNVVWHEEEPCFRDLATELSYFYSRPQPKSSTTSTTTDTKKSVASNWEQLLEDQLYPLYKTLLYPSSNLQTNTFHSVTNITNLYKVFERC